MIETANLLSTLVLAVHVRFKRAMMAERDRQPSDSFARRLLPVSVRPGE
ncbi:MAG: hypothetical protein IT331_19420 [Anaerolineae bacterium]|nr:hypothetical protein [Anaerolineae bacterium]